MTTNNPWLSTAECYSRGEVSLRSREWSGGADNVWGQTYCPPIFFISLTRIHAVDGHRSQNPFLPSTFPIHSYPLDPEVLLAFHRVLIYLGEYPKYQKNKVATTLTMKHLSSMAGYGFTAMGNAYYIT